MSNSRVALFVRNGLVGHDGLNKLIPRMIDMGYEPVLYNTGEIPSKRGGIPELADLGFYETTLMRDVVFPYLNERPPLLDEQDKPIEGLQYSLQHLAQVYGLDCYDVPDVNHPEFLNHIIDDDEMIGAVSMRILQIFKPEIISVMEEKGFLWNLHTGALPEYKGVHIPYRCIANGETEYGWTLHYIEKGIDTGDIIATDALPIDYNMPVLDSYLGMVSKGVGLVATELELLKERGVVPEAIPQSEADKESYYTFPTATEMAQYDKMGVTFVDISKVVDTYVSRYSIAGTAHAAGLRLAVMEAIGGYERSKELTHGAPVPEHHQEDDLSHG